MSVLKQKDVDTDVLVADLTALYLKGFLFHSIKGEYLIQSHKHDFLRFTKCNANF